MISKILKSLQLENNELFYKNAELIKCVSLLSNELENEIYITDLIDKIRESIDLEATLSFVVNEITDLTKSGKCIIYLIDQENKKTLSCKEFRIPENITSISENLELNCLFERHYKNLEKAENSILLENIDLNLLNNLQKKYFVSHNIKSIVITPIMNEEEFFGLILVHQNDLLCDTPSDSLKKFSNQAASSIKNVILYSRLIQETEDKSKIIKNIPVELKNHITSLSGFSQILLSQQQDMLSEKQKQYLANIVESIDLLNKTINDLTFSSRNY